MWSEKDAQDQNVGHDQNVLTAENVVNTATVTHVTDRNKAR